MKIESIHFNSSGVAPSLYGGIPCYNIGPADERFPQNRLLARFNGKVYNISPSVHESIELLYIIDGSMCIEIGNRSFDAKPGELYVANPYEMHASTLDSAHQAVKYVYVQAVLRTYLTTQLPAMSRVINGLSDGDMLFLNQLPASELTREIGQMIHQIVGRLERLSSDASAELAVIGGLHVILSKLIEAGCLVELDAAAAEAAKFVRQAAVFIEKYYSHDITPELIYSTFPYNPSYFSRLFKKHFGKPFRQYLNEFRISRAVALLLGRRELSVRDVASRVGFSDYSYFSHVFKKVTGRTAGDYVRMWEGKTVAE